MKRHPAYDSVQDFTYERRKLADMSREELENALVDAWLEKTYSCNFFTGARYKTFDLVTKEAF